MPNLIENAMGPPSKAWTLIKEFDKMRSYDTIGGPQGIVPRNPFADIVSVEVIDRKEFDGMSLETADEETVTLTIRIPEQFFEREFLKSDWELSQGEEPGFYAPEHLIDAWEYDVERELYGPDGNQVPLW